MQERTAKSWLPTKKWFAAAVVGAAGVIASVIESGEFGDTEEASVKALILALVAAYVKSNDSTPGGVPTA